MLLYTCNVIRKKTRALEAKIADDPECRYSNVRLIERLMQKKIQEAVDKYMDASCEHRPTCEIISEVPPNIWYSSVLFEAMMAKHIESSSCIVRPVFAKKVKSLI